jgi:hypothetical protein
VTGKEHFICVCETSLTFGDYGDICDEDDGLNDIAIKEGRRILSVYKVTDELTIWIITEADRSSTCMLLPDEY